MNFQKDGDGSLLVRFSPEEKELQLAFLEGKPIAIEQNHFLEDLKQVIRTELAFPITVDYTTMIQ